MLNYEHRVASDFEICYHVKNLKKIEHDTKISDANLSYDIMEWTAALMNFTLVVCQGLKL